MTARITTHGSCNWTRPHRRNVKRNGDPVYAETEPCGWAKVMLVAFAATSVGMWWL